MRPAGFVIAAAAIATVFGISAVNAADVGARMVPRVAAPLPVWDWTGFYLGAYAGIGVQRSHGKDPTGSRDGEIEFIGQGFTGGGTAGYNYQVYPNWVVGVEGDIGYLGLDHAFTDYFPDERFNSKTSWIGTARARVGYSSGGTLTYGTVGGAWVNVRDVNDGSRFGFGPQHSSKTNGGFAIGSGIEARLGGNWTAKAEYLYVDVGDGDLLRRSGPMQVDKHRYDLMKFGVNYVFGDKPQVPLVAYNWTGAYAGIIGGSATTSTEGSDPSGTVRGVINNNGTGYTVGGIAGYNWQVSPLWVAGVEGDFSWFGLDHTSVDYFDSPASLRVDTSWLATARARVGYSAGQALLYVTAGGAWVNLRDSFKGSPAIPGPSPTVSGTKTLSGLTVGGGIESPFFSTGWMSRTEYLFVSAGKGNTLVSGDDQFRADHDFHLFRFALVRNFTGWN